MLFSYYTYDCLSPLVHILEPRLFGAQAQWLQAADTIPGIVTVVFAGIIVDTFGAGRSAVLFALTAFCGSVILLFNQSFASMFIGRMIFGAGVEPLIVAILAALAAWFRGRRKGLAMGIALGLARFGSALAFTADQWTPATLRATQDAEVSLLLSLGSAASLVAVLCAVAFYTVSLRRSMTADPSDRVRFGDILRFPHAIWVLGVVAVGFYSASYGFSKLGQDVLGEVFDIEKSGLFLAVMTISAMIVTPIIGHFVDRYPQISNPILISGTAILAILLASIIYGGRALLFTEMVVFGISIACISAALWPLVPTLVPENRVGTAYGVITMMQNLAIVITTFIAGWAKVRFDVVKRAGAIAEMYVFIAAAMVAFLAAVLLVIWARRIRSLAT
jgi:MFS family permease